MRMKPKKSNLNHLIVHLILLAGVAVVVFPFLWMILTSFKTSGEAMKIPPTIFPENFVTTAYHTIVSSAIPFGTVYMNTIISTAVTTLVQIAFCSMAGYAFARIDFPFKNALFVLILSVLMVPGQIFLIPQYQIIQKMGLLDTIPALFMPDGVVAVQVTYDNGKITAYKEFFSDGTLKTELEYNRGLRHGEARFYYSTGHLFGEGKYKKGRRTGTWKYYKVTGEIEKKLKF